MTQTIRATLLQELSNLIAQAFRQPTKEFEVRLGMSSATTFECGISHDYISFIRRLNTRLQATCQTYTETWKVVSNVVYLKASYANDVRQICRPPALSVWQVKRRISHIDIASNHLNFRACVSEELPYTPDMELVKSHPLSVQYIRRTSYQEIVPLGKTTVILQYDVSKVSPNKPTKSATTQSPCRYHVELEIKDFGDMSLEDIPALSEVILFRTERLMGSYIYGTNTRLPLPKLEFLTKNPLR